MSGYSGTLGHGFVGLSTIKDDKTAKKVFKTIDADKSGKIMLDEWCAWLKNAEVEANTALGQQLVVNLDSPESKAKQQRKDDAAQRRLNVGSR